MDTQKLRYFSAVAETGSLTKASQLLGISHSGISKAISALETETKLNLFQPLGRGLEITQEGKWLYQKAQEILRIADEIGRGEKRDLSSLRIGLSGVIAMTCAGYLAEELRSPLSISEIDIGELEGKIVGGELDFGFAFIPSPRAELDYHELGEVSFNSYAREDVIGKFKAAEAIPFVVPTSDFPFNPLGYRNRDAWPKDVSRFPHFAVNSFAIALNLLRLGQGAIYMPDFVAGLENSTLKSEFKIVKVKEHRAAESRRKLFFVKSRSSVESSEMKKMCKVVRRVCCSKS
jgi:DNA-binding transcriptional LysR family regulator